MCWPHIELDSGVSPTDEIDWFSALQDWRTCFAESHNSRLFQQCVKLKVLGIACSYRVGSLCFSRCGPLTSINRAVDHGIFRSTTESWSKLERLLRESALRQKYRKETKCTDVVRRDSELHSQTKIGDIGRVRIELGNFYMGEAGPGGRRRDDQAHEGESLRILRFCTVRWKNTRIPQIRCRMGTSNFVILKTDISAENWMESMENQWNSSGRRGSRSRSHLCISASPTSLFLCAVRVCLLQAL